MALSSMIKVLQFKNTAQMQRIHENQPTKEERLAR